MIWGTDGIEYGQYLMLRPGFVECAAYPGEGYIINETWDTDPMNPAVMWRTLTPSEIDAEKEALAQLLNDLKPVIESVLEIIFENPDLVTAFTTIGGLKTAVKDRYKSKLP